MTSVRENRLRKELSSIQKNNIHGIKIEPSSEINDNQAIIWNAWLTGAEGTPYHSGTFHVMVKMGERYPFEPPKVKFATKIFHPNISPDGKICINILKNEWNAGFTIEKILLSILALMSCPNPKDPLVPEIANLYLSDKKEYDLMATNYTKEYASSQL